MNRDFDSFVKEHLQDILCEAEKEHALFLINRAHIKAHQRLQVKTTHHVHETDVQLQDCAISPSFSQSQL